MVAQQIWIECCSGLGFSRDVLRRRIAGRWVEFSQGPIDNIDNNRSILPNINNKKIHCWYHFQVNNPGYYMYLSIASILATSLDCKPSIHWITKIIHIQRKQHLCSLVDLLSQLAFKRNSTFVEIIESRRCTKASQEVCSLYETQTPKTAPSLIPHTV